MLTMNKKITDVSDVEMKFMMAQRLVEVADVIQAYVTETVALRDRVAELGAIIEGYRSEIELIKKSEKFFSESCVKVHKYGEQRVLVKRTSGGDCVRFLYTIKPNGSCLAWSGSSKADPPNDDDLVEWTKDKWLLVAK